MSKQNPFARFILEDIRRSRAIETERKHQHTIQWWADHLGVERTNVTRWMSGERRIGPLHEDVVFPKLHRYWSRDPDVWRAFVFSREEYRASVPTAKQKQRGRRQHARASAV